MSGGLSSAGAPHNWCTDSMAVVMGAHQLDPHAARAPILVIALPALVTAFARSRLHVRRLSADTSPPAAAVLRLTRQQHLVPRAPHRPRTFQRSEVRGGYRAVSAASVVRRIAS